MCFMLFTGTEKPLLREWKKEAPAIWVRPVLENEAAVKIHFTKPVVQYVGSTASCGCDFPHTLLLNGELRIDAFDARDEDTKGRTLST